MTRNLIWKDDFNNFRLTPVVFNIARKPYGVLFLYLFDIFYFKSVVYGELMITPPLVDID